MSTEAVGSLRRRMIEDMMIRQFGAHTRRDYIRQVWVIMALLGRSPEWAEPEDPGSLWLLPPMPGPNT